MRQSSNPPTEDMDQEMIYKRDAASWMYEMEEKARRAEKRIERIERCLWGRIID